MKSHRLKTCGFSVVIIMAKKAIIFISCGIFREELEYLLKEKGLDWNIIYLEAALHVNFDRLKKALVEALEENQKAGIELKVLYGHCHPEIMAILEKYDAKKIEAGNCLEALVGPEEIRRTMAAVGILAITIARLGGPKIPCNQPCNRHDKC